MSDRTDWLRALARRVLDAFLAETSPDAALLGGSAARPRPAAPTNTPTSMLLYYETLPADEAIAAARGKLGGTNLKPIAPRSEPA